MPRIIASLILIFFAFMSLSCAPPEKDGVVTVTMMMMPNSLEPLRDIEDVLKDFKKEHPKIKVKVTVIDWGAAWTRITTAAT